MKAVCDGNNTSAGDWSDKGLRPTTDRTESTLELVDMIKKLSFKLTVAECALNVLAKGGNQVAQEALNEMNK